MKNFIILLALILLPISSNAAAVDYYLKIDTIKGEVSSSTGSTSATGGANLIIEHGKAIIGTTIILDATKSSDDGTITRFSWKQTSGPTITILNSTSAKASFVAKQLGKHVIELTATNSRGATYIDRRIEVDIITPNGSTGAGPAFLEIDTIKGESPEEKKVM